MANKQKALNPKNDRRYSDTSVALDESQVQVLLRAAPLGDAARAIGTLRPGIAITGITKGQFSLLDLVRAVLEQTGPAHVVLSTWTFGIRDAEMAAWLVRPGGPMLSLKFLVDKQFESREPKYCARIRQLFGAESIVLSVVHAKFATLKNDAWNISIRSSMNLNRNPRWEQFDLNDCPARVRFFDSIVAELESFQGTGFDTLASRIESGFDKAAVDDMERLLIEQEEADRKAAEKEAAKAARLPPPKPPPLKVDPLSIPVPQTEYEFLQQQYRDLSAAAAEATSDRTWIAVGQLQKQKNEIYKQLQQAQSAHPTLTPEEAHAALIEQVIQAPPSFHWEVWQRLTELHPEWTEAEPVAEVVAFPGGKR